MVLLWQCTLLSHIWTGRTPMWECCLLTIAQHLTQSSWPNLSLNYKTLESTFICTTGFCTFCRTDNRWWEWTTTPPLCCLWAQELYRNVCLCTARHGSIIIFKFADDTTVLGLVIDKDETAYREEVSILSQWYININLCLNISKTKNNHGLQKMWGWGNQWSFSGESQQHQVSGCAPHQWPQLVAPHWQGNKAAHYILRKLRILCLSTNIQPLQMHDKEHSDWIHHCNMAAAPSVSVRPSSENKLRQQTSNPSEHLPSTMPTKANKLIKDHNHPARTVQ